MKTSRTKQCRKRMITFNLMSILTWVGVAIFTIVSILVKIGGKAPSEANKYVDIEIKSGLIGLVITIILALIVAIFISEKMRTTIYMLSVIAGAIIYGNVCLIIEFSIYMFDEYIFKFLADKNKRAFEMNKEIDLRKEEYGE